MASYAFIIIVILNNILYQTNFQINQIFLVVLLVFVCILLDVNRLNKKLLFLFVVSSVAYIVTFQFQESLPEKNRAIFYYLSLMLYLLLFFNGHRIWVPKILLYVYFLIYLVIALIIFFTADRDFINPNWIAATLFFLFAFTRPLKRIWCVIFLLFGVIVSLVVYESRGSTVVFAIALLAMLSQVLLSSVTVKILYIFMYFLLVAAFWLFLDLLSSESGYLMEVILQFSDRGLGGRESALIQGYLDLKGSNYFGIGPAASGGYLDPVTGKPVHIHFGFLDIALKFSIFGFFLVLLLMMNVVIKSSYHMFPMVAASFMIVFFYNGLALSHFGLNVFVIALMSKVLFSKTYN
tara:strand:- start:9276 stop:10325 length:1050 start_codon:yes stop_codon:yes gene_type:complete